VRDLASLRRLILFEADTPGVPAEVLSQNWDDDCLGTVRAHFRDVAAGAEAATDVKLIVLGNGRVGETQICRRLRNEPYDDTQPSTHGIQATYATFDTGDAPTRLNIWDFGGQDLYHGTHALFLRTSAIFLLVRARETENEQEHTDHGIIFRNRRLPYWLAYVRHLAARDSPALIVQTRCDRPLDDAWAPPIAEDTERPEHCAVVDHSALNGQNSWKPGRVGKVGVGIMSCWCRESRAAASLQGAHVKGYFERLPCGFDAPPLQIPKQCAILRCAEAGSSIKVCNLIPLGPTAAPYLKAMRGARTLSWLRPSSPRGRCAPLWGCCWS